MFCVKFGLVGDQVIFQDLASPETTDEEVFGPEGTDGQSVHRQTFIKDVDELELVQEDLEVDG